jgi:hypothetical protein
MYWRQALWLQLHSVSPLQILAQRAMKTVEDSRLLPNSHARDVVSGRLRNGDVMLFLHEEVDKRVSESEGEREVEYFTRLSHELHKDKLRLLVLIVPTKYTVYGPLLLETIPSARDGASRSEKVEQALRAGNIDVLNLTAALRRRAAEDLVGGEYVYYRDDTHWNARGIACAAEEVRRKLSRERQETGNAHEGPNGSRPTGRSTPNTWQRTRAGAT